MKVAEFYLKLNIFMHNNFELDKNISLISYTAIFPGF